MGEDSIPEQIVELFVHYTTVAIFGKGSMNNEVFRSLIREYFHASDLLIEVNKLCVEYGK